MHSNRHFTYSNVMSTLAVFLALAGGSIAIASVGANDVGSQEVKEDSLKSADLRDDKAVKSEDVTNGSLVGLDIDEDELDVGAEGLDPLPAAKATAGGPQTIPDGIVTTVAFDNAHPSSDVTFDPVAENLTVEVDGVYVLTGEIHWAVNTTGRRVLQIFRDGSSVVEDSSEAVSAARTSQGVATVLDLEPGDVLTLQAQQTSGGDLATAAGGNNYAAMSAVWVSP